MNIGLVYDDWLQDPAANGYIYIYIYILYIYIYTYNVQRDSKMNIGLLYDDWLQDPVANGLVSKQWVRMSRTSAGTSHCLSRSDRLYKQ